MVIDDDLYEDEALEETYTPRGLLSRWAQRDAESDLNEDTDDTLVRPLDPLESDLEESPTVTREINQRLLPVLIAQETGHRIRLPDEGKLTLGSLNPFSGASPDVDLTLDDRRHRSVAAFHAQIIARDGEYYIEDLRSVSGSWLNDERLLPRTLRKLTLGDEVRLGGCTLHLQRAPSSWQQSQLRYSLYATATGQRFPLPCQEQIIIGRADRNADFTPDIDLAEAGEAALLVSRRHAAIYCEGDALSIIDLGSTNRTKVDGVLVSTETPLPLSPGQHIWLGGFGLVVDVDEGDVGADSA